MSSSRQLLIAGIAAVALVGCQKDSVQQAEPSAQAETVSQPTAARIAERAAPVGTLAADDEAGCTADKVAQHEPTSCGSMAEPGGGCNQWDDEASDVTKRAVPETAVWTSWSVDGMTCGGCERRIIANVGRLDGVVAVEANAELGRVRVALAADAATKPADAKARIAELGYRIQ